MLKLLMDEAAREEEKLSMDEESQVDQVRDSRSRSSPITENRNQGDLKTLKCWKTRKRKEGEDPREKDREVDTRRCKVQTSSCEISGC